MTSATTTAKASKTYTKGGTSTAKPTPDLTPKNPAQLEKAIAIGQEMTKQMATDPNITKADIARKMYETIHDESRDVIVQAFINGAGLTPKGAMTYYYNVRRKAAKSTGA